MTQRVMDLNPGIASFFTELTTSPQESKSLISTYHAKESYHPLIPTSTLLKLLSSLPVELIPPTLETLSPTQSTPTPTPQAILEILVQLSLEPTLSRTICRTFSPIKEHFWVSWLEGIGFDRRTGGWSVERKEEVEMEIDDDNGDDDRAKVVTKVFRAMVNLLGVHPTIYQFLSILFTHPLLTFLPSPNSAALATSLLTLNTLLTYLPTFPHISPRPNISLSSLEKILQSHPQKSIRHLAWRVYKSWFGLHSTFGDKLKEKWVMGSEDVAEKDGQSIVPFPPYHKQYEKEFEQTFGKQQSRVDEHVLNETEWFDLVGETRLVDGGLEVLVRELDVDIWCLPVAEGYRDQHDRKKLDTLPSLELELEPSTLTVSQGDLSPLLVAISASPQSTLPPTLLFREGYLSLPSTLAPLSSSSSSSISTPSSLATLHALSLSVQSRLPTLLTSAPSSGKLTILRHLFHLLHPHQPPSNLVLINLSDRSLDSKSLLGSLASSTGPDAVPGTFTFLEGTLTKAVKEGRWLVLLGIENASMEVLSVIKTLVERMWTSRTVGLGVARGRGIGGERDGGVGVKAGGKWYAAQEGFFLFATRSVNPSLSGVDSRSTAFPAPIFLSSNFFEEIEMPSPTREEILMIVGGRFERLERTGFKEQLVEIWEEVRSKVSGGGSVANGSNGKAEPGGSVRPVGIRDLLRWCRRVNELLPPFLSSLPPSIDSNPLLQEEIFLEARDVFLGSAPNTTSTRFIDLVKILSEGLGIGEERREWLIMKRRPDLLVPKRVDNGDGRESKVKEGVLQIGRVSLPYRFPSSSQLAKKSSARPYALTKPSLNVLEKLAVCLLLSEPVLMVGETGTGKTAAVGHLANLMGKELVALNLSNQTEAGDLVGGFKPIDEGEEARRSASELVNRFIDLFGRTFSLSRNADYVTHVKKAFEKKKWSRLVSLWREANRMALDKISSTSSTSTPSGSTDGAETPRKKRKVEAVLSKDLPDLWRAFLTTVGDFELRHVLKAGKSKFMFAFVEGPLAQAIRNGDWVLLDEVNLAAAETLEALSTLLQTPDSSLVLTEQGDLEPIPRHPEFRLFACMNPATDVGKRDLPPALRSKFSEIWVPPPDEDREALVTIVQGYISHVAVQDRAVIMDIAELYSAIKTLAIGAQLADGSNSPPHFSMRTLARALTFTSEFASIFGLRRALFEGVVMAFTMLLDPKSAALVRTLLEQHIVARAKNRGTLFSQIPPKPSSFANAIRFGPYWLEAGPEPLEEPKNYILTPSVQAKVLDLARAVLTRKVPVLIQGPTSAGKTSVVEYLAKRTGHRFVRINNHEHTDIQEYIGTYVSDPDSGKLVFQEGILVRALRRGDWIVLDELNLAPTDVLEALNRLLDDNRELVIPETGEVVKPHPHFMLFATQNPPGLYGGRKVLSRAFRNRFLEMHFGDVPQDELETILCERCEIAPSYAKKTVAVFVELQRRRQAGRVFEKHSFATLRDLFRWGGRGSVGYQQLAEDGYMLLAERARRPDDKAVVKNVIEQEMKVTIDEATLYDFTKLADAGLPVPPATADLVWTSAMRRLYYLIAAGLLRNEPVLLVGDTGSGKTSVCQSLALALGCQLHVVGCHQNTETADLLGGQRPLRNRTALQAGLANEAAQLLGLTSTAKAVSFDNLVVEIEKLEKIDGQEAARDVAARMRKATALFEWHDGPLVQAMHGGDLILLDEISLADDSVLERLNSVLEPSRMLVLAEKGGQDLDDIQIVGAPGFQLLATMNPGGDFGKKELSPALRNRFTEIWVPAVSDEDDLLQIIDSRWRDVALESYGRKILDFGRWFGSASTGIESLGIGLRDILAWIDFMNVAFDRFSVSDQSTEPATSFAINGDQSAATPPPVLSFSDAFCQGALMAVVDGLGALPATSGLSQDALARLRSSCWSKLESLVRVSSPLATATFPVLDTPTALFVGSFGVAKGTLPPSSIDFSLRAPTTRLNANRLIRALQLPKPVLLEGSPGVGKTSLVTAIAAATGHALIRINLSDQTDLMDLLGSDLPVEGGKSGEFSWKDAPFLAAMQEGAWVLLDEMNLASQAILEGLNSCLDHRGTVYIPELDRTFSRHPEFRIFAAQNPLGQGGGRKGLPRSFLDRFSIVHMEELDSTDLVAIASALYPEVDSVTLNQMIAFNSSIHRHTMELRSFGIEGSPWEFNLRDVLRWLELLRRSTGLNTYHGKPLEYFNLLYLQRFRTIQDREVVVRLFAETFGVLVDSAECPRPTMSSTYFHIGHSLVLRGDAAHRATYASFTHASLQPAEALAKCLEMGWLAILTGPRASGKTTLVRQLADLGGHALNEFAMNAEVDTLELLGSFEQADQLSGLRAVLFDVRDLVANQLLRAALLPPSTDLHTAFQHLDDTASTLRIATVNLLAVKKAALDVLDLIVDPPLAERAATLRLRLIAAVDLAVSPVGARFEWIDGPLVTAMKHGSWLLIEDANLCSPSVLDRLNSLFEPGGRLQLAERGPVNGEVQVIHPHPAFRLVMTLDPRHGELSRAMRNRGIEIALLRASVPEQALAFSLSPPLPPRLATDPFTDPTLAQLDAIASAPCLEDVSFVTVARHLAATSPSSHYSLALRLTRTLHLSNPCGTESVLRTLSNHALVARIAGYKGEVAAVRDVPQALLFVEPSDPALSSLFARVSSLSASTSIYSSALDALATASTASSRQAGLVQRIESKPVKSLTVWDKSVLNSLGKLRTGESDDELAHLSTLSTALSDLATALVAIKLPEDSELYQTAVKAAQILHSLAYELEQVCQDTDTDFSSIQLVATWIGERLSDLPPQLQLLAASASLALTPVKRSLVLTTGHEMGKIWRGWLPYLPPDATLAAAYSRLLVRGRSLTGEVWPKATLVLFLDIVVTLGVPHDLPLAETESTHTTEIVNRLLSLKSETPVVVSLDETQLAAVTCNVVSFLAAELGEVARAIGSPEISPASASQLMDLTNATGIVPMNGVVPLHQLSAWSHDVVGRSAIEFQTLATWAGHNAMAELGQSSDFVSTAADLIRPMLLRAANSLSGVDKSTLGNLPAAATALNRAASAQALAAAGDSLPRSEALREILVGCVRLLFSTVGNLSPLDNVWDERQTEHTIGSSALTESFVLYFGPLLADLQATGHSVAATAKGFVAFGRTLWKLYVPNIPLDPAIGLRARAAYLRRQVDLFEELVTVTRQSEANLTGNQTNGKLEVLRRHLASLAEDMRNAGEVPVTRAGNPSLLTILFRELRSVQDQVLSDRQLDGLLAALGKEWTPQIASRESNLQHSVGTLLKRLSVAYDDLEDIVAPVRLALCTIKIGFSLLANSAKASSAPSGVRQYSAFVHRLSAFPFVARATDVEVFDLPLSLKVGESPLPPALATLVQLSSLSTRLATGSALDREALQRVTQLYDRMHYLWTADRRHEEAEALAAESLYKSKTDNQQIASDEEQEAAEFAQLFPTFDHAIDEEEVTATHISVPATKLLQPSNQTALATLHRALFGVSPSSAKAARELYDSARSTAISHLIEELYEDLEGEIDQDSAAYRVRTLVQAASKKVATATASVDRDFYNEPDIQETAKAVPILDQLVARLATLIELWPDQMVLHNLRERCEAILAMSSSSSIAKILTAIEQLLQHTEDWESYASREHSLVINRSALTNLIVEWRRLELTCWSRLLSGVQAHFGDPVAEWWFRFYETTIRGAPGVGMEHDEAPSLQESEEYYRELVALLDSFMSSSSVGQFATRLDMVLSFSNFAGQLGKEQSGVEVGPVPCLLMDRKALTPQFPQEMAGAASFRRVSDVMLNLHAFYDQFTPSVAQFLRAEVGRVEKDVKDVINLASWKDVNVYALRQSAVRSHHQLYKSVRKLRAILQKPSSDFFALLDAERTDLTSPPGAPSMMSVQSHTLIPSFDHPQPSLPDHIVKLDHTYRRLAVLATSILEPFVTLDYATPVDDFAVHIITTAKRLKDESKPGPEEGREQRAKGLASRKRRALGELLKELKRLGLTTPSPATLDFLRNVGAIYSLCASRDGATLPSAPLRQLVSKIDSYHFRLLSDLAALRACPASHHEDISTRDIQRAIGSIERCIADSYESRDQLLSSLRSFADLERIVARLDAATRVDNPQPALSGGLLAAQLHVLVAQVGHALEESLEALANHRTATRSTDPDIDVVQRHIAEARVILSGDEGRLVELLGTSDIDLGWSAEAEIAIFRSSHEHLRSIITSLAAMAAPVTLRYLLNPLRAWMSSLHIPELEPAEASNAASSEALVAAHRSLVDFILVLVQELRKVAERKVAEPSPGETLGDQAVKTHTKAQQDTLKTLRLRELASQVQSFSLVTHAASSASPALVRLLLTRVVPFLRLSVDLAERHLVSFLEWQKATLKLSYVLTSVVRQISSEGFCRPADDDGKEGDATDGKTMDGTGMADGQGATNVSKDIEDESQVEGLQGDVENEEKKDEGEKNGDDDAVEMSMDFEGEMEDRGDGEKGEDGSEDESESESHADPEEQVADVDPLDPSSVDEKFWGDEKSGETEQSNEQINQDTSQAAGESEMAAKEDAAPAPQPKQGEKEGQDEEKESTALPEDAGESGMDGEEERAEDDQEGEGEDGGEEEEGLPQKEDGERLDERMPEADNLDLPDDLQLDGADQKEDDVDLGSDMESMAGEDEDVRNDEFQPNEDEEDGPEDKMDDNDEGQTGQKPEEESKKGPEADAEAPLDNSTGGNEAGETGGEGLDTSSASMPAPSQPTSGESGAQPQSPRDQTQDASDETTHDADTSMVDSDPFPEDSAEDKSQSAPSNAPNGVSKERSSATEPSSDPNQRSQKHDSTPAQPQRSLGDALQSWRRRLEEIADLAESEEPTDNADASHVGMKDEVEFVQDGDARQSDDQALGPATEEQVQGLEKLRLREEAEEHPNGFEAEEMDVDDTAPVPAPLPSATLDLSNISSLAASDDKAIPATELQQEGHSLDRDAVDLDASRDQMDDPSSNLQAPPHSEEENEQVEQAMLHWRSGEDESLTADGVWRLYESLTRDLSYALTEQLRLILEPTLATRLKGDYRSGKRLNMKKIIPYIASEFTKDKIWLRRTRPSQREYQILIAIDDSKSMADSHSVHLAYQTLALVSRSLARLEVGGVSICRFGQSMEVLHPFESGPISDEAGANLISQFTFAQGTTDVRLLVEKSLTYLTLAKEQAQAGKSSSAAADLWQLQIIISDGLCQDHEKLRALLRKANEMKVVFVFVVLDSLHKRSDLDAEAADTSSILAMKSVSYTNGTLKMTRYLDSFPFEYFIVLRDVEALPEILSSALRQFFEKVSSDRQ